MKAFIYGFLLIPAVILTHLWLWQELTLVFVILCIAYAWIAYRASTKKTIDAPNNNLSGDSGDDSDNRPTQQPAGDIAIPLRITISSKEDSGGNPDHRLTHQSAGDTTIQLNITISRSSETEAN